MQMQFFIRVPFVMRMTCTTKVHRQCTACQQRARVENALKILYPDGVAARH
eukprot:COSAG01_NODE_44406_length_419_cov_2.000000_1_plen_50_part_10